jgi:hypothetical protein
VVAGGGGGAGIAAGIFVATGRVDLVNCTIAFNSGQGGRGATGAGNATGAPGQAIAGGIFNYHGTVSLLNTLIAANSASNSSPDVCGSFVSTGFNLIGNSQGSSGLSINDFQNVPADVGPPKDNGGGFWTCDLLPGSLAVGYGTSVGGPLMDQRGVPRPENGSWDIGALQAVTVTPMSAISVSSSGFLLMTIFDSTNAYRIQASTNLTTWLTLTNFSHGGAQRFVDSTSTNLPRRFFRTITN